MPPAPTPPQPPLSSPPPSPASATLSENGGVVYPVPCVQLCSAGMTLRDCFATAALQGIATAGEDFLPDDAAEMSYQFADAMLTVRGCGKEVAA